MTLEMQTTFQRLCIRPEIGFVYDKSSMVEMPDGISLSELLVKSTSKCDTNLLLLSSHKGKIKDFSIKLIGIETPSSSQSGLFTSVLSGVKKSFSFLNNSTAEEGPCLSDVEQIEEAWKDVQENGFHGLQVITLIDKDTMPDNECRKLYNLYQYVTTVLQSINAYYMFQKPDVSFLSDIGFNAEELKDLYPRAECFALAVIWKFVDNPLEQSVASSLRRATPIVSKSTSHTQNLLKDKNSDLFQKYNSPKLTASLAVKKRIEEKRQSLLREINKTPESKFSPKVALSPVEIMKRKKSLPMEESQDSEEESSEEEKSPSPPPVKQTGRTRCLKPATSNRQITSPVSKTSSTSKQTETKATRTRKSMSTKLIVPTSPEIEVPAVREIKPSSSRSSKRSAKRTVEEMVDSEDEEDEITVKKQMKKDKVTSMEVDENMDINNTETPQINPDDIAFPDEAPKVRIGRKSMVASARKSLANEWPVDDQEHMLHFFDNLNPSQSETSRIALSCKYALLQYNRDLSSKLLYQWVEKKGRTVQRQVTDFSLKEDSVKPTVLELYKSLSDIQAEATRVSFTLKFMKSQYSANVTSKQLFAWLKEKKTKK